MKPLKLRTKLTLLYAAIFAMLLAGISVLFYRLLAYQLDSALTEEIVERAAGLHRYLRFEGNQVTLTYDTNDPEESFFVRTAARYYQVYDLSDGKLVATSPEMESIGFQYTLDELKEAQTGPRLTSLQTDQARLLLHRDAIRPGNGKSYLLQVGVSLESRDAALDRLLYIMVYLLPGGLAAAGFAGWWMAGSVLKPLVALSSAAQDISIAHLDRRLPLTGAGDELDSLAQTFNDVFSRLEESVTRLKEFTTNISHELRTPITILRGEAELALADSRGVEDYRQVLESQLEELEKLSGMVSRMLTLARAEAGQIELKHEFLDFSELVHSVAEQIEPLASSRGITLASEADPGIRIIGDAGWLERVVLNLLDNAIKFGRERGHIHVRVNRSGNEAMLEVRDDGMGIEPEILPHIFERFYRADPSRSKQLEGAGLGLSLVDWIVKNHQGRISVQSQPGKGSSFRVALPLAGPENPA